MWSTLWRKRPNVTQRTSHRGNTRNRGGRLAPHAVEVLCPRRATAATFTGETASCSRSRGSSLRQPWSASASLFSREPFIARCVKANEPPCRREAISTRVFATVVPKVRTWRGTDCFQRERRRFFVRSDATSEPGACERLRVLLTAALDER